MRWAAREHSSHRGRGHTPTQHAPQWVGGAHQHSTPYHGGGARTNEANPTKRGATHQHNTNPDQANSTAPTAARPGHDQPTPKQAGQLHEQHLTCKHPQQRQGTNTEQADHEAANTTVHQQNHGSGHDMTKNRPHANRPTPNQPGMQGSKQERRPTGWRKRGVPRPPTTIPINTTEHVTLPLRTRPTNVNKLHYTRLGRTKTRLTSTDTDGPATQTTFGDTTTGSSATEPTQTKLAMRRPRQPRTNHTAAAAAT